MKFFKLAVGLVFAVFIALVTGTFAEKTLYLLLPSLSRGTGVIVKVIIIVIAIPLCFYFVESFFIRREKGR